MRQIHQAKRNFFLRLTVSQTTGRQRQTHKTEVRPLFTSHCGMYHVTALPFGVTNASVFSTHHGLHFIWLTWKKCLIYIDDVTSFWQTVDEHNNNLADVLLSLKQQDLKLNSNKCHFLKIQIEYLRHFSTANGISPTPSKVQAVQDYRVPENAKAVHSFLDLTGNYHRYIPNYATISSPLTI